MHKAFPQDPVVRLTLTWLVLLAAVACVRDSGRTRDLVERTQVGDTTVIVAHTAVHPGGGRLVADMTIGLTDGPEEYLFGNISAITVAQDGSIFVLDRQIPAVRKYDAGGRHVLDIGRSGEGPGEFRRPVHVAFTDSKQLLVADPSRREILVFDENGIRLDVWHVASSELLGFQRGQTYVRAAESGRGPSVLVLNSTGSVTDTLYPPHTGEPGEYVPVPMPGGRPPRMEYLPYSPGGRWNWSPLGYFVTGSTDRYNLNLHVPPASQPDEPGDRWNTGDPIASIRRRVAAVVVPASQRSTMEAEMHEYFRKTYPGIAIPAFTLPDAKPAYQHFDFSAEGRLWVSVLERSEEGVAQDAYQQPPYSPGWTERTAIDIFEPSGVYVGRVSLAAAATGTRFLFMRGDTAWARALNLDGAPIVVRYRIVWD